MLISPLVKWYKSGIPHPCMFRNFTHWAWAIWHLCNQVLLWIFPDPGCHERITWFLKSICGILIQAGTRHINIAGWGQHSSNCSIPYLVTICDTIWGTGDQPNENPGILSICVVDCYSYTSNREIQQPGMLIVWKICQLRIVRCANDWDTHHSSRKHLMHILPAITCVHLSVSLVTLWIPKANQFHIEVSLK